MRESLGYPNVTDTANHSLSDAFISIHVNAGGRGAETFCYWRYGAGGRLAACIQNPLVYGKSLGFGCYGLLENGIRVKKGDEMQKIPIQAVLADDIIGVEGGKTLEQLSQARKKDHVFEITNTAIERVPVVETPLFSDLQNNFLASLHREVLRIAKLENAGKEVALVTTISFGRPIKVLGDEHSVNIEQSSPVNSLKMNAYMGELVVAHNHPTTRNFSFSDIGVFVIDEYIATLSVVTNQGQVYVMQKSDDFHYDEARQLINALVDQYELLDYPEDEARQEAAAKEFLKKTRKVGIWYGTSK